MTITGDISDLSTGEGLNGATVQIVDNTGKPLGGSTVADPEGYFLLSSPILDTGGKVMISQVGYQSVIADPSVFNEAGGLGLERSTQSLETAVVTAKTGKKISPLLLIGGGVLLFGLLSSEKKKGRSMGAIDFDWSKLILPAAILGGGYFLYTKLKPSGPAANAAMVDENTKKAADDAVKAAQDAGIRQSIPDTQINTLANTLYVQLTTDPVDQNAVRNNVIQVNTLLDWNKLVQSFGSRKFNLGGAFSMCALTGYNCDSLDLGSALKASLDLNHISDIDTHFSIIGIPTIL